MVWFVRLGGTKDKDKCRGLKICTNTAPEGRRCQQLFEELDRTQLGWGEQPPAASFPLPCSGTFGNREPTDVMSVVTLPLNPTASACWPCPSEARVSWAQVLTTIQGASLSQSWFRTVGSIYRISWWKADLLLKTPVHRWAEHSQDWALAFPAHPRAGKCNSFLKGTAALIWEGHGTNSV